MAMQAPSSSSFSYHFSYDVFISFRGPDTRFGFTGNLYKALIGNGIQTFIDDKDLQRGDEITPSLLKSIEDSRIAIVVFSKGYASSSFCLDELVHIIDCSKAKGRMILPVFYGTDPSHIRHLNDSYGEAHAKHEGKFQNNKENMERLQKWKIALSKTADLSGYHFNLGKEYEHNFIEKIVKDVSNKINRNLLHVADYLVGLEPRILEISSLLNLGSNDGVCIIGIHGTGGMGKTTLARGVYDLISNQFEGCCFLHNVREKSTIHGLEHLQEEFLLKTIRLEVKIGHVSEGIPLIKQRLSQMKLLLILDDVDELKQLRSLVGEPDWLGPGSKVIITTRDKHLLACHGVERTYDVYGLNKEEALELFRLKVGKNKTVDSSYEYISNRAVTYACGLPLAIEVVGSNFSGKHISEWKSTLDKYERVPHKDIHKILKLSFDSLDEEEKSVFLDIDCCLKGCRLLEIEDILQTHYGYCIKNHVGVLVDKSLIKISDYHKVTLHDLIENMGKEIVRQESPKEPGNRSRLWFHDDIVHVLKENMGTEKIEIIHWNSPSTEAIVYWNEEALKKMKNLKTLMIENGHFFNGERYVRSNLRVLKWKNCSMESLSSIFVSKTFEYMKVLKFDDCHYLTDLPDVSGLQNLENLSFENCYNLMTIHNSIGYLNKLQILNAKCCLKLKSLPPLRLTSLKELLLCGCRSLESFPELLCMMTHIEKIYLFDTSIGELPLSFQNLCELRDLTVWGRQMLKFSSNICRMPKLSRITVSGRPLLLPKYNDNLSSIVSSNVEYLELGNDRSNECLPIALKWFSNVKHLILSNNYFKILPKCLHECHLIDNLYLSNCKYLEEIIGGIPPNLKMLSAMRCESLSSSSRRILLSQQLHEDGCTQIILPTGGEGIPEWFKHKIRGRNTISFWFRKEIPSITSIILLSISKDFDIKLRTNLFVNGSKYTLSGNILSRSYIFALESGHTFLFDLKLKKRIKDYDQNHGKLMCELDKALLKNEWIHVELNLESSLNINFSTQMGIHVFKKKINFIDSLETGEEKKPDLEEDVIFTDPYREKKSVEDLNSLSLEDQLESNEFDSCLFVGDCRGEMV